MRLQLLGLIALALLLMCSCAAPSSTQSYAATAQAQTVYTQTAVRSAVDGTTEAPGPQEIIGIYVPFVGTGLSLRGGLLWDGASSGPITIPIGPSAARTQAAEPPCAPSGRWVTESRQVWVDG